ncbi:lipoyl(octanoyl) transferase LipB [Actinokineospora bangkokensis]|uniref:Octanoyltransferase n=1 Tax=Actinokineospora bangkokensis TaxID=1193682 RepID=A0A1Q9LTB9_9PSEU|nr:lipoyl(octanoyl) transferase LipB [Actinokineospora bangkokensis]OLR95249.1 lipoate-protein ligase B [Actinokineospora bangkokensis]
MSAAELPCRASAEPVQIRPIGTVEYRSTWDLQRELATARADDRGPDVLLLLEHEAVYTAGKRTADDERPDDGTPVVDVDRGGKITWHGPGQLVGYPIVKLSDPVDVVQYVRRVEEAMIAVCAHYGLQTGRVEGRSGVWLPATATAPERKISAVGIRVQRGVTMHGFQLNCANDLAAFDRIIPCGIRDAGVTSLSAELDREVPVSEVLPLARDAVLAALDGELTVQDHWLHKDEPSLPGVTFALRN